MKNILLLIPSFLALGSAVTAAFLAWQVTTLRHANDELSDDKVALLIDREKWDRERQSSAEEQRRLSAECQAFEKELARVREEKDSLGRSLVATLDRCAKLQTELKQKGDQIVAAEAKRVEQEKTIQEKIAREKAALEKATREKAALEKATREKAALEKAAREQRAREKAEADRLAVLAQNPLRVEHLKPIDPKKAPKSDKESLEELLELTSQKGSKGTQTKDVK